MPWLRTDEENEIKGVAGLVGNGC